MPSPFAGGVRWAFASPAGPILDAEGIGDPRLLVGTCGYARVMIERKDHDTKDGPPDQDAEPSLNAPGDAGPTGVAADDDGEVLDRGEEPEDQDAEPSLNAPGEAGPTGTDPSRPG
jgi:hypothetical protein